jgi:hypothetical protein
VSDQLCKDSSASIHPPLLRRSGVPAISVGSGQVQFKSFFRQMQAIQLIQNALLGLKNI